MSSIVAPEPLAIEGPAGSIEALLEWPAADLASPAPSAFGVVCHPHPQFGGALTNKVVHTVARAFRELGVPTLRFNFRGVGGSAGTYDEGRGETADLLAVVGWARTRWPERALWLAGFSFGSYVALRALPQLAPQLLVTVAPPVGRWDFSAAGSPACPWLIVQGDQDELVDHAEVARWSEASGADVQTLLLPGADHFFHGRLHELRDGVEAFARKLQARSE